MADAEALFATAVQHSTPEEPAEGVPGEGDTRSGAAPMIAAERHCSGIQPVVDDLPEASDADLSHEMNRRYRRLDALVREVGTRFR